MLALAGPSSLAFVSILVFALYLGIPIWAIVSVCRNLHGALRIFWIVFIAGAFLFIPLIGIFFAIVFLTFKRRFVAIQR